MLPQDAVELIELINNQLKLLLNLVNGLLDYKMLQEGVFDVKAINFCPTNLFEEIGEIFALQAQKQLISLKFKSVSAAVIDGIKSINSVENRDCGFTLPEILNGDNVRLQQILINLVKNALKFTARNGQICVYAAFDSD